MIERFYENAEGYIGEIGVVRLVTFRYFHCNLILLSRTSTSYISVLARYILLPSLPSLQGVSELKTAGNPQYMLVAIHTYRNEEVLFRFTDFAMTMSVFPARGRLQRRHSSRLQKLGCFKEIIKTMGTA